MRVALVTGIFPPDVGGPATYVPAMASALVARGHQAHVITTSEPSELATADAWPFPVVRVDRRTAILRRTQRVAGEVARVARHADVVYANGMFLEAALGARRARRPLVAKVVGDEAWERATTRGWTDLDLDAFQTARLDPRLRALAWLRSAGIRAADHVIVPSRYLHGIVVGWGVDPSRCTVVYNAVAEAAVPAAPPRAPGPLRVLTAGRLVAWKGVDLVLEALRDLPGATLTVVGDGPCREALEARAQRDGLAGRVCFTGRTTPDALHVHMRAHDVFVLASSYEGLPHVVLEAMQQGAAVVASRAGGTPEVVEDGATGLLVERTSAALRDALARLDADPALRRRLADGGRRLVATRFRSDTMIDGTERVLARAARGLRLVSVGSDRLGDPLTASQRRKLDVLDTIAPLTVVGYQKRAAAPPRQDGVRFVLARDAGGPLRRPAGLALASVRTVLAQSRRARLVVLAQSPYEGLAALAGRALGRLIRRDVRVVVETHGDWIEVGHLLRFPRWSGRLIRAFSRLVLARADTIRTVSTSTANLARRFSRAPIVTFPAFVDLDLFLATPAAPARRHLLFAGVLTPVKGIDILLDALALLVRAGQAVPLVVAGDGPDRPGLEQQAERLGLRALVTFRGHLDQHEVAGLMASAHAVVLPSHSEGLPRVLIEAMACETPVVASRVGGIPELVRDRLTGRLVTPGDARGLADALAALLADPSGTQAMGRRARADVGSRFAAGAWAASQRRMIELVATRRGDRSAPGSPAAAASPIPAPERGAGTETRA